MRVECGCEPGLADAERVARGGVRQPRGSTATEAVQLDAISPVLDGDDTGGSGACMMRVVTRSASWLFMALGRPECGRRGRRGRARAPSHGQTGAMDEIEKGAERD